MLARRALPLRHPRLTVHTVDFAALPPLSHVDEAYLALGTTIRVAGSQTAFRAVDFDANLAVARAARAAGATRLGVVSAMGANPHSPIFYNRVKGELEEAVSHLGYQRLVFARPSFLAGNRDALGQPQRSGEKLALKISSRLRPFIPRNMRSIEARHVAQALLHAVPVGSGSELLLSGDMQPDGWSA